jgi:hypothetical protein
MFGLKVVGCGCDRQPTPIVVDVAPSPRSNPVPVFQFKKSPWCTASSVSLTLDTSRHWIGGS